MGDGGVVDGIAAVSGRGPKADGRFQSKDVIMATVQGGGGG